MPRNIRDLPNIKPYKSLALAISRNIRPDLTIPDRAGRGCPSADVPDPSLNFLVEPDILASASLPGPVGGHSGALQLQPGRAVGPESQHSFDRRPEGLRRRFDEHEPGGRPVGEVLRAGVDDGVGQTAGRSHDGTVPWARL